MLYGAKLTVNEAARLTNTTYPVVPYINKDEFPEQNSDILGTEIFIKYRDFQFHNVPYDEPIKPHIKEARIYVLRYDIVDPYILIGVVQDGKDQGYVIVLKRDPSHPDDIENYIAQYPEQKYNFLIKYTKDVYGPYLHLDEESLDGTIIRCDSSEPAYAVVAEITADDKLRFILVDEAVCMMDEHPPKTIVYKESDVYDLLIDLLGAHELYGK